MITTRRSDGYSSTESARGGVDVLERTTVQYASGDSERAESMEETKARMKLNLDRLLNYDRYSETQEQTTVIEDAPAETERAEINAYSDEDIRPTTTTTQFIDGDPQIFNDAAKSKDEQKNSYRLNGKGKLVVVMYALVVTVILALIVLNTGVLKALSKEVSALEETYRTKVSALAELNAEIEEMAIPERILTIAENELGMVSE